jgi:hypothetical protein
MGAAGCPEGQELKMATFVIETMNPEIETKWRRVGGAFKKERDAQAEMDFMAGRNPANKYRVVDTDVFGTESPAPAKAGPFWYQTQERAMAPGSGDGWPEVIRPQHSGNARLVRRDGNPEAWMNAIVACGDGDKGGGTFDPKWEAAVLAMPPMKCGRLDMHSYDAATGEPERFVYVEGSERTRVSGPWCDEIAYAAQRYKIVAKELADLRALIAKATT